MSLIALLRNRRHKVVYDQKFDPNWSDDQLFSHVVELDCHIINLTYLPDLPNCQKLVCWGNQLTTLPDLPKCRELWCSSNRLTSLPDLPNCQILHCRSNRLTSLPVLPNCQRLDCDRNRLTTLPDLPSCRGLYCSDNHLASLPNLHNCRVLFCYNNPLPFEKLEEWRRIWKAKNTYLSLKYLRLWYQRMLQAKAKKKQKLHLELIWSPETKFYQQREEYQHFLQSSQPK